jgi:hypothetical protein
MSRSSAHSRWVLLISLRYSVSFIVSGRLYVFFSYVKLKKCGVYKIFLDMRFLLWHSPIIVSTLSLFNYQRNARPGHREDTLVT